MKIVTSAQMTALEQASEKRGVSTDTLMENAGLAVAEAARKELGGAAGVPVLVLVGPGNNGADGLVAARYLRRWGAEVTAFVVSVRPQLDPKMELAQTYGVAVRWSSGDTGMGELDRLLGRCRLVIDAVLGTGLPGGDWKDIEVVRHTSGAPSIKLHGRCKQRAQLLGVQEIAVSLSHSREYAVASVVVRCLGQS